MTHAHCHGIPPRLDHRRTRGSRGLGRLARPRGRRRGRAADAAEGRQHPGCRAPRRRTPGDRDHPIIGAGVRRRAPARRGLPDRARRRPEPVGGRGLRHPRLPRLARGVPTATRPRRRIAPPRALPDVHPERQHGSLAGGRAHRGDLARVRRRARGGRVLERAVRADPLPRLHRGLRHELGRALSRDGRDAGGSHVHVGGDLRRPRSRAVPSGRARGGRDHQTRPAGGCPAPARRSGPRRAHLRDVGPHPRPHPHARRPAVRPVHDQAAHALLPLLTRGAAVRPDRVPGGGEAAARAGH